VVATTITRATGEDSIATTRKVAVAAFITIVAANTSKAVDMAEAASQMVATVVDMEKAAEVAISNLTTRTIIMKKMPLSGAATAVVEKAITEVAAEAPAANTTIMSRRNLLLLLKKGNASR
jgi:hypothetical protein